jgi:hypothetical protein
MDVVISRGLMNSLDHSGGGCDTGYSSEVIDRTVIEKSFWVAAIGLGPSRGAPLRSKPLTGRNNLPHRANSTRR